MHLRTSTSCEIHLHYSTAHSTSYHGERNLFSVNNIIIRELKKDCAMLKKEPDNVMSREKCTLRSAKTLT